MSVATIDLADDQLLTLSQACRQLPSKPAPSTLWRWRTTGVKINGCIIKLECVRVGGQWMTTRESFATFLRQQTDAALHRQADDQATGRPDDTQRRLESAWII